jgi:inosine/xanthosine triphosphatase
MMTTDSNFALRDIRRVVVGSANPVKLDAVRAVLTRLMMKCEVVSASVESGVPDQPFGDDETIRGASARAQAALTAGGADLGVGIEGGVVDDGVRMRTCAWAAVATSTGVVSVGGSLAMPLPPQVAALVRDGMELGHAMDVVSGGTDTKKGAGAVGILTAGLVDRRQAYETLVTYALAPLLAPAYWRAPDR